MQTEQEQLIERELGEMDPPEHEYSGSVDDGGASDVESDVESEIDMDVDQPERVTLTLHDIDTGHPSMWRPPLRGSSHPSMDSDLASDPGTP